MKIQQTPEEIHQAQYWWAEQKKKNDMKNISKIKRKTLMLEKIIFL